MRRFLLALTATFSFGLASLGCGQPCDQAHLCVVEAHGFLCDGSAFVECDDTMRGKTVTCPAENKTAVCTPTGWTFQN